MRAAISIRDMAYRAGRWWDGPTRVVSSLSSRGGAGDCVAAFGQRCGGSARSERSASSKRPQNCSLPAYPVMRRYSSPQWSTTNVGVKRTPSIAARSVGRRAWISTRRSGNALPSGVLAYAAPTSTFHCAQYGQPACSNITSSSARTGADVAARSTATTSATTERRKHAPTVTVGCRSSRVLGVRRSPECRWARCERHR